MHQHKLPQWEVFHGRFIRKLAEQSIAPAREVGCTIDVGRSNYANKQGTYAKKYREKRSRCLASGTHFTELDFLRAGKPRSRELFPELPNTPYFINVARKHAMARLDEGYPLRLQEPLPIVGLPLGAGRPDLPMDLASAFRSAYKLGYRGNWLLYDAPAPKPPLDAADQDWVNQTIQHRTN